MNMESESYCLVLSGGGTKGVYHIGVWRALKELGIPISGFVGASIGAIIAAFLAQGLDEELEEFGRSITMDNVLNLPPEMIKEGAISIDREAISSVRSLLVQFINKKGLDTSPFRRTISEHIKENEIRAHGKDLGIMTVNLSSLEPRHVFIDEMEDGTLVDYLMASSAFPGFEQPQIEGKRYIDGGIYDNIPYAMARKRGYRRIIVSDVSGLGWNRRPQIEGSITVYIKNSIDMGGVLEFDRAFLDRFALLGYLDTLRVFGRLIGYEYFIKPDPEAEAAFAAESMSLPKLGFDSRLVPDRMKHDRRKRLVLLECAASILDVERLRTYSYDECAAAIKERREAVDSKIAAAKAEYGKGLMNLAPALRETIATRSFSECPYYYYKLIGEVFPKSAARMLKKALSRMYPELPVGIAWIDASAAGV